MMELTVERHPINHEALDAELRAVLGDATTGVSIRGHQVVVHLLDSVTPEQVRVARALVEGHDPQRLTPEQQAQEQRRQRVAQLRQSYGSTPLDLSAFEGALPLIRQLAQKVAWLEQELLGLRHGVHPVVNELNDNV